ncbi:type I-E CRISPR-associated protein Cas7/Cse4/CasC [Nonomuraea wenchangensis]|uniref:type I-E CRISPR-associated protein Cas7/Cse4/CasC n=1 Tax=Nonomuraea wenchangensis TaxID=568860 RepID=UPI0037A354F2
MIRTILEIHALQTVPPSCLNRDDTGTPKMAIYGGVRRARVSSQAWKRATRHSFHDLLDPTELGIRTRRVVELLAEHIRKLDTSIGQADALILAAETIRVATGARIDVPKRREQSVTSEAGANLPPESRYLMFLSAHQLEGLAEIAVMANRSNFKDYFKSKGIKDQAKLIANTRHSIDIALFGRMIADGPDSSVDAAAQVAHAISVHRVDNEEDFYTAVDDYKGRDSEDVGAGMLGMVEFNSATLYRYAAVDVDLLGRNLGVGLREIESAPDLLRRAVETFVQCFLMSMPTGRINTFGNHTLPDAVLVKLRDSRPINLVGAFEEPCHADPETGGYMRQATEALVSYLFDIEASYGVGSNDPAWVLHVGRSSAAMATIGPSLNMPDLIAAVGAEVVRRQS